MMTLFRLLRAGFHGLLLFVLPWILGGLVGFVFDVSEVSETSNQFATFFAMVVLPLFVIQLAAIGVKVSREVRAMRGQGARGPGVFVAAVDRHVRLLTGRGLGLAAGSLAMVGVALAVKWAQLGILAVAGLGLMYIASTAATLTSAFSVRAFDDRVRRGRGAIDREMSPTVVDAGDPVEERFALARVPVPFGFRLHIEEALPERLGGDTRFALDRSVSRAAITVAAPLPRTPRGRYKLGPADIWYEDVLGLTRVFVASRACASLRALPRLRSIVFDRRPKSRTKAEGSMSVLSRLATEEHFRTRTYVPGDDLRRVHWKQSINTGQLVVRVPEAVPFAPTRVRLVLDTFLPVGWRVAATAGGKKARSSARAVAPDTMEDVLDLLVEAWVGLAHMLMKRGESVSLVAVVRDEDGALVVRDVECKRGEERKWRALGSDVAWQSDLPLEALLARSIPAGPPNKSSSIVVGAGLAAASSRPEPGTSYIVADGSTVVPDPPKDALGAFRRFFFFDYPVGADDNRFNWRKLISPAPPRPERVRSELSRAAAFAVDHARAAGAPVLLVRRRGLALALEVP